uniref:Uncharacterized protein n=1 Tax=Babesia bovis TaxID=5865 RepID=S6B688_BABBO|nr:hypothetical protein [Babesia bovis]
MLYPYNFYVYPSDDCVMHLRSSTVTWLHAQGFNFMRWISEGRGYCRLECEASTSGRSKRQKKVNRYGLQRYLEVIKKHNKPLVVHNGLLDLLHLYDKFIGVIPELPGDICNALYTKLGPGIYDTKYVSRTLQSLGIQETLKVNSLETIYRYYDELVKFGNITEICDTESHLNYSKCFSKAGMNKAALVHEAGFDALLTARVFAGQISLITKADSLPPDYVPVHSDDPTDMGTTLSAVINRVNIHDQIGIECVNLLTGTG